MTTKWMKKRGKAGKPQLDPEQQSDDFYDGKLKIITIDKDDMPFDSKSHWNVVKQKLKSGGRAGFKVGGAAKRGISKILRKK